MSIETSKLEILIAKLSDIDLARMVTIERGNFSKSSLNIADKELRRRGITQKMLRFGFFTTPKEKLTPRFLLHQLKVVNWKLYLTLTLIFIILGTALTILRRQQAIDKIATELAEDHPYFLESDIASFLHKLETRNLIGD